MALTPYLPFVMVGTLRRDYLISLGGTALNDVPGGHLFYSAMGAAHWEPAIGLVSRLGAEYPIEWLQTWKKNGVDVRGIKQTGLLFEQRCFIRYDEMGEKSPLPPMAQYALESLPFPKSLLGYQPQPFFLDHQTLRNEETIIARDIPEDYLETQLVHFCPMDFLSHNLLIQHFSQFGNKRIVLKTGAGYMHPSFFLSFPELLNRVTALITTEKQIKTLFAERRKQTPREMAMQLSEWGPEWIVIQERNRANWLFSRDQGKSYRLPAYPTRLINWVGGKDGFAGGFSAGLLKTYDPIQALVYGNVASSFICEGNSPYYAAEVVPDLYEARSAYLFNMLEEE